MRRTPFHFKTAGSAAAGVSEPLRRASVAGRCRVTAHATGKGHLNVELHGSSDLRHWSVLDRWQIPSPVQAAFGEVQTDAPWLRARVESSPISGDLAVELIEEADGHSNIPEESKEHPHGR
jgi:hypothetical protein